MTAKNKPEFIPKSCQRCQAPMQRIPGQKTGAFKCKQCGLEVWEGDIPSWRELDDMIHSSTKELISLGYGHIRKKGGSKAKKKRKKKKIFIRNYIIDAKPRNKK